MTGRSGYEVAGHYDEAYFADLSERYRSRNRFARQRIENVLSMLPALNGRLFIDIGCGMGTFTFEAARRGARALGVDMMHVAVRAARRVGAAEGVDEARFVQADAKSLPVRDRQADVVVAADLTEHLDDATLALILRDAARVLRPDGVLIIYTPSETHFIERLKEKGIFKQDPSHIGVRTADDLVDAIQRSEFLVESVNFLPSHVPVLNKLERKWAERLPLLRRRVGIVARKLAPIV